MRPSGNPAGFLLRGALVFETSEVTVAVMKRKQRKIRTAHIYCVEKDYGGGDTEILYCFTHKKSADKVSNANSNMRTRKKKLIRGAW